MEAHLVRERARSLGLLARTVAPILGGWGSWTFEVDGSWIFRVARTPEAAAAHHREVRLLPELAPAVSFSVPLPVHVGDLDGRPFLTYRRLPGRPLQTGDGWAAVAGMLRQLRAFPPGRASELLGCAGTVREWYDGYAGRRVEFDERVLPLLDPGLRTRVRREYEAFLAERADFAPVLVHGDLGTEHILVDPATRRPTALIDFEDAAVGDPAIDFVGALVSLGAGPTRELMRGYGGEVSWDRLRFYWWVASAEAVSYGVEHGDEEIVRDGIAGLRQRFDD